MSLLVENEIQNSLTYAIQNIDLNIISLIINYTYPDRFLLFIHDVNDLVNYFKYPNSITNVKAPENEIFVLECFMTNITDCQYTLNYRLIFLESVIDNSFHYIHSILFNSDFTNRIITWMIN